jgi:hypothetical protein
MSNVNNQVLKSGLRLAYWNCNYVLNKISVIADELRANNWDILALGEIKTNEVRANYELRFPNYNTILRCRESNPDNGGGVCVLIRDSIRYTKIETGNVAGRTEMIAVKIGQLTVAAAYNPPNTIISRQLLEYLKPNRNLILFGDLNAKHLAWGCKTTNEVGRNLIETISEFDLLVLEQPNNTYIKHDGTGDKLDWFVVSTNLSLDADPVKIRDDTHMISDHYPIEWGFRHLHMRKCEEESGLKRKKLNVAKFNEKLTANIDGDYMNNNIDAAYVGIIHVIKKSEEEASTEITAGKPRRTLPREITDLIRQRKKVRRQRHRDPLNPDHKALDELLKIVINEKIEEFENGKWNSFLKSLPTTAPISSKPFWNRINQFREPKNRNLPALVYDGGVATSDSGKVSVFANHLYKVFNAEKNPSFSQQNKTRVENELNKFLAIDTAIINRPQFTLEELKGAIKETNNKRTSDAHGLSNYVIKQIKADQMLSKLLDFYNRCLNENVMPIGWKRSLINMIPKKAEGPNDRAKDYRPISITDCLCRLGERLINRRLMTFLEANNLLVDQQSGFRRNRQCKDNLFTIAQTISETKIRKKKGVMVTFDIAAAFDSVIHDGLLAKMIRINTPAYIIHWTRNFLNNRSFIVRVGQQRSLEIPATTGVPQGGVLSPALFNIFINDSPSRNKPNIEQTLLFADDKCYINTGNKSSTIHRRAICFKNEMINWSNEWWLNLALHKCWFIEYNSKKLNDGFRTLQDEGIANTRHGKFLGMIFDEKLTYAENVKEIMLKCEKRVNIVKILSQRKYKLNKATLVGIYCSLIRSLFDYNSIMEPNLCNSTMERIESFQIKTLRLILRCGPEPGNNEVLAMCGLTRIRDRMQELNRNYLQKAILMNNPLVNVKLDKFIRMNRTREGVRTILDEYRQNNQQ